MAAYCRVSSSSEDQLNSFAAQNIHYTQYITEHDDWRLVDIYADEGITGTSVEKRDNFKRMLADSGRGLIDRILVKSISRFARNTAECLEAIRQFRANGTTIFFEKENIDTARMSSELMTALYVAFSQSESESISGNMRWSYQRRMERGKHNPQSAGFSIVDVVGVPTDSVDPTAYWRKPKQRLKAEGNEIVTNCHSLKMTASDGKTQLSQTKLYCAIGQMVSGRTEKAHLLKPLNNCKRPILQPRAFLPAICAA